MDTILEIILEKLAGFDFQLRIVEQRYFWSNLNPYDYMPDKSHYGYNYKPKVPVKELPDDKRKMIKEIGPANGGAYLPSGLFMLGLFYWPFAHGQSSHRAARLAQPPVSHR